MRSSLKDKHALAVKIVRHPNNRVTGTLVAAQQPPWPQAPAQNFAVQAKRSLAERIHAWNERARSLIAHHDRSNWAPLAWVWLHEARPLARKMTG